MAPYTSTLPQRFGSKLAHLVAAINASPCSTANKLSWLRDLMHTVDEFRVRGISSTSESMAMQKLGTVNAQFEVEYEYMMECFDGQQAVAGAERDESRSLERVQGMSLDDSEDDGPEATKALREIRVRVDGLLEMIRQESEGDVVLGAAREEDVGVGTGASRDGEDVVMGADRMEE